MPLPPFDTVATVYYAGMFATFVVGRAVERRFPPHQRAPLSAHCGLCLLWPLYLAFLAAVLVLAERDPGDGRDRA